MARLRSIISPGSAHNLSAAATSCRHLSSHHEQGTELYCPCSSPRDLVRGRCVVTQHRNSVRITPPYLRHLKLGHVPRCYCCCQPQLLSLSRVGIGLERSRRHRHGLELPSNTIRTIPYDVLRINHERCREMLEVEAYFREDTCHVVTGCSLHEKSILRV